MCGTASKLTGKKHLFLIHLCRKFVGIAQETNVYVRAHSGFVCNEKDTVCSIQLILWVDYLSSKLAAPQHGTITMEGDNLIVLNGGFCVSAPPAGSCQVVISHYGR